MSNRAFDIPWQAVVESGLDALVVVDDASRIAWANAAAVQMFGYVETHLVGRPLAALLPDRLRENHERFVESFLAIPRARYMGHSAALLGRRQDGSEFALDISLTPFEHDGVRFVVAVMRDASHSRAAEQRLRDLLEQAPDGVFVADLGGRYTTVNEAGCRILGLPREQIVGRLITDFLPPEDVPELTASRERLSVPGTVEVGEWRLRHANGDWIPVEVSARLVAGGQWQAFVRDISVRRAAEDRLRRAEESLNRAQSVAQLGSWDWDLVQNTVWRSREFLALHGASPAEAHLPPLALLRALPTEDRLRLLVALDRARIDGEPYELEHRILRADGERVVLTRGEVVREGGRPVRLVGTVLDITDRKRLEREREEALQRLRIVLEEVPVGIGIATNDGHFEGNRAMAHFLGRANFDTELVRSVYERGVNDPVGRPIPYEGSAIARALAGERVERLELSLPTPDGGRQPVLANAAPIRDPSGKVLGAVTTLVDIAPLKELEALRAQWNSIVAHDLRQPINTIHLLLQLLDRHTPDAPSQVRAGLQGIRAETSRLGRMVQDLLDSSRLEVHELPLSRIALDLGALVEQSVQRAGLLAPDQRFLVAVAPDLPAALGDPGRLAQVMDNLLSNAVKYGNPRTAVAVDVGRDARMVSVAVTNGGPGIPEDDLPQLFQRFRRARGAPAPASVGLGLYIASELVTAHGGRITVESSAAGPTTFRFTVPIALG